MRTSAFQCAWTSTGSEPSPWRTALVTSSETSSRSVSSCSSCRARAPSRRTARCAREPPRRHRGEREVERVRLHEVSAARAVSAGNDAGPGCDLALCAARRSRAGACAPPAPGATLPSRIAITVVARAVTDASWVAQTTHAPWWAVAASSSATLMALASSRLAVGSSATISGARVGERAGERDALTLPPERPARRGGRVLASRAHRARRRRVHATRGCSPRARSAGPGRADERVEHAGLEREADPRGGEDARRLERDRRRFAARAETIAPWRRMPPSSTNT